MKTRLTHLILATILLSGCDHIKIEITENGSPCYYLQMGYDPPPNDTTMKVEYTNTSRSKYIEATIKYTYKSGFVETSTIKLKPGEIEVDCLYPKTKVSVVGEREIKDND